MRQINQVLHKKYNVMRLPLKSYLKKVILRDVA